MSQEDDPRLAFIYGEAVRGLSHQQGVVESLNSRAGNLIFAAAFATSLLGTRALSDGLGVWDWAAMSLLFVVGAPVSSPSCSDELERALVERMEAPGRLAPLEIAIILPEKSAGLKERLSIGVYQATILRNLVDTGARARSSPRLASR